MLLDLFNECVNDTGYISTPYRGNYKMQRDGRVLTIYFQKSCGVWDWLSNFDFAAVPYRNMADRWRCHRGFLRVWRGMRDEIAAKVQTMVDGDLIEKIECVGYSHGGAVCALAVEDLTYRFGDRVKIGGWGFGAPRVIFGHIPFSLRARLARYAVVRCSNDIVTKLPPRIFGYRNADAVIIVGEKYHLGPIQSHTAEAYRKALQDISDFA